MSQPVRVLDPREAVAVIESGMCIGLGGSVNMGHPMALVRALARSEVHDLTITALTSGVDVDLLVGTGQVRQLSAAYVGSEDLGGLPPAIRWRAEEGELEVHPYEEGVHLAALRARAQRQPYATWTGALGTNVTDHPLVDTAFDEKSQQHYLKVRPLHVDVALLWAEAADEQGNLLMWGAEFGDEALRNAADLRIVQVERLVQTRELTRHPERVVPWGADIVVPSPWSTHPFGGHLLREDKDWIREYGTTMDRYRRSDDRAGAQRFITEWLTGCVDEDEYFQHVGAARIRSLFE